jgi:uncharacterized protein (DUF1501 family)
MTYYNRRRFLRSTAALGFGATTGLFSTLAAQSANAMDVSGYKALVCLFFKGGMDGFDTLFPHDQESYDAFKALRPNLFDLYDSENSQSSRNRDNLTLLGTGVDTGSRSFALSPQMAGMKELYDAGDMAVIGNVGPLIEPTTRDSMENGGVRLPKNLFSHNDQQSTWMSFGLEGRRDGWGAGFAKKAIEADPNNTPAFTAITASNSDIFLRGTNTSQFLARSGQTELPIIRDRWRLGPAQNSEAARDILRRHFASQDGSSNNLLMRDVAQSNRKGRENGLLYAQAANNSMPLATEFPNTNLGRQMKTIAETISFRGDLQVNRQVFYASIGGFDTHDNQATKLPGLHQQISDALTAFQTAMTELGTLNDVTTFTAADFGRSITGNGNGSDHGWGSHHFVIGGAVKGGQVLGDIPPYDLTNASYTEDRGRLIPTTSVDQYAASLGQWFGLNPTDLNDVLPHWQNFDTPYLDLFV